MKRNINISVVIAVYQRADELRELLQSLSEQSDKNFEVIVVDDGSPVKLEPVIGEFEGELNIKYFYKTNSGPGKSRNYGMERASGNYFIFLDSDTVTPENYIQTARAELTENYVDAFGGPDAANESFSGLQKAISFSMTSFMTTGGIRGGKKHIGKFQPRSFNMGISKEAFEKTGGFRDLRMGEDPDLSMTLWENGFETRLLPEATVYHKRRASLKKFAKQVYEFGVARPILNRRHPKYTKLTFWFPAVFLIGLVTALVLGLISILCDGISSVIFWVPILIYSIYFLAILTSSSVQNKSLKTGTLSIFTTLIQFTYYGVGFLNSWFRLNVLKQKPEQVFPGHFYK